MQIGLRLHDSAELPLAERLQVIKAQGFTCVHMALSKTAGETAQKAALTPGYAMHLRRTFAEAGLDIAVLGNYQNLANPNPERMKEILEGYKAHIRFASILGCGMVGTETGAPNEAYRYDKEACHSEEALDVFITNLKKVVRYAEQMGVILAIEPVYKHIVWNPKRARTVLDEVASPNLQIIFDPVNLLHGDNLDRRDEVIDEAVSLLGDEIAMIHLKDYVPKEDGSGELACMGCGLGQMDYRAVLAFAKEKKPWIHATLENTVPDKAEASRAFIERIWDEV
ncbi:MAG: sugar phosphate isomerase/epimerase [Lachnospiraceae bacterium]|nr:sugar phosphate isomerase/epimerase [Lachnospiraceae bacterium]